MAYPWLFPGFGSVSDNTCIVDGVVEFGGAQECFAQMARGAAIPKAFEKYQHLDGFDFQYSALGLFVADIPTGLYRLDPVKPISARTMLSFGWDYSGSLLFWLKDTPEKIFQKTLDRVQKRLNKKKDCRSLFKNVDPLAYLRNNTSLSTPQEANLFTEGEQQAGLTNALYDSTATPSFSGTTKINRDSFFATGQLNGKDMLPQLTPQSSMYGLGLDEIRELVILHEIYHVEDAAAGVYDDKSNKANSIALNKFIRSKCF